MRLAGRIAVVTGGTRGIGHAIAQALAAEGAVPVVTGTDGAAAARVAAALGPAALGLALDVTQPASVAAMAAAVLARHGRIDILVNNAGIGHGTPFLDLALADWNRTIAVNLTGAFLVAQACARSMATRRTGRIVNIGSVSGQRASHGRTAYAASKAGLEMLTRVMAVELAPVGIAVNALAPGPVETERARQTHDAATRDAYARRIPMRRYATPQEVAAAAVFLCGDDSGYVTGHTLNVDGGFRVAGLIRDDPAS